jgi:hypothetical protein
MRPFTLFLFLLVAFCVAPSERAGAQSARGSSVVAVYLQNSSEDAVGRSLAYEIREALRRSTGFVLVDTEEDARLVLRLVTLDPDREQSPGLLTVFSAVYTARTYHEQPIEMYLTSSVGTCGRDRLSTCAQRRVAELDEWATQLRSMRRKSGESTVKPS